MGQVLGMFLEGKGTSAEINRKACILVACAKMNELLGPYGVAPRGHWVFLKPALPTHFTVTMQQGQPGAAGEPGPTGPKVCSSLTQSCSMNGLEPELLEGWEGKGELGPRRAVCTARMIELRHLASPVCPAKPWAS